MSLLLLAWSLALRAEGATPAPDGNSFSRQLITSLEKRYPGARIEVSPGIRWTRGQPPEQTKDIGLFEESANGEIHFRADGESFSSDTQTSAPVIAEGFATFSAYVPAWIAVRRVPPGERLDSSAFTEQEVNVASGQYRDIRGLIISAGATGSAGASTALTALQTRQTILEGGALLSSAVEHVPDVRRGDAVRINLVSGDLTLTVPGLAQEPAYLGGHVRVITDRTKRELVGELAPDGIVEVRL